MTGEQDSAILVKRAKAMVGTGYPAEQLVPLLDGLAERLSLRYRSPMDRRVRLVKLVQGAAISGREPTSQQLLWLDELQHLLQEGK